MESKRRLEGICNYPFESMQYTIDGAVTACCWSTKYVLGNMYENSMLEIWNNERMQNFRASMHDGTYRYCDLDICPKRRIDDGTEQGKKFQINKKAKETKAVHVDDTPRTLELHYDQTCNLKCPTCRLDIISQNNLKEKNDKALKELFPYAEVLTFGGVGDPFVSNHLREFFFTVSEEEFSNVKRLVFVTNALLVNKSLWDKLSPAVKSKRIEFSISIDAASKETYALNRGGDWETLLENMKFISSLNLEDVTISMVVQNNNFQEMKQFINMGRELGFKIVFQKLGDWNTFSSKEYSERNVWSPSHPNYQLFKELCQDPVFKEKAIFLPQISDQEKGIHKKEEGLSLKVFNQDLYEQEISTSKGKIEYYNWTSMFVDPDYNDCITQHSVEFINRNKKGMGGGLHLINHSKDFSSFKCLNFSIKSKFKNLEKLKILLLDINEVTASVCVDEYGFKSDDCWHNISIDLEDFSDQTSPLKGSLDLKKMSIPFAFSIPEAEYRESFKIDNVHYK